MFPLAGDRRQFRQPQARLARALAFLLALRVRTLGDGSAVGTSSTCLWITWLASIVGPRSDHQRVRAYCVHSRNFLSTREVKSSQERASRRFRDRAGGRAQACHLCAGLPCSTSWLSHTGDTDHSGFCSVGFSHRVTWVDLLSVGSRVRW